MEKLWTSLIILDTKRGGCYKSAGKIVFLNQNKESFIMKKEKEKAV